MSRSEVRRQLPSWLVLTLVFAGLGVAAIFVIVDRWRRGAFAAGVVLALAAVARLALTDEQAGLLAVRSKPFDVGALAAGAIATVYLALSIDPLGTGE